MKRKILIIHNPKAGKKKNISLINELEKWNKDGNHPYDYIETKYSKHAFEIAKKAKKEEYNCIVAAGGDGTINEIASALINTNVNLGIIPMGSGNGLARHNLIPLNLEKAFLTLYNGKPIKIDAGLINENYFFCAAGIGFDAKVSEKFAKSTTRGLIYYFLIALKEYLTYKSKNYHLQLKSTKCDKKAFFITFANANQFGNHAYIAPQAIIDDGLINICIVKPFPWYQGFRLAYQLFNKKIEESSIYESFKSDKVDITSKNQIHFHYDGEIMTNKTCKIEVEILPKALQIIVP